MKKITPFLFLLTFCLNAMGQTLAISMTTSKAVGSSVSVSLTTNDANTTIWSDFGNGSLEQFTVTTGALNITRNVAGSQPIKIYGTGIKSITCRQNQLTSLDVSLCTALLYLYCDQNQLTTLNVSSNTNLRKLDCYQNQLFTLDLTNNPALTELNCYQNKLNTLTITSNSELTYLDCGGNKLTTLNITQNTKLTFLSCSGNSLSSLDVSKNSALTSLDCSSNKLTYATLPVKQNNWQQYLYSNQSPIIISKNIDYGNEIDVSSQYSINGNITTYVWKTKTNGTVLSLDNDYTITNGKTTFLKPQTDSVYCEMTNALFPLSNGINALKTTCIKITGIIKQAQTITFYGTWVKYYLDGTFTILAEANSYLPLSFTSSDPSIASISGNTATFHKGGSVTITATQAGDNTWYSVTASKVLTINKTYQEIDFRYLPAKEPTDAPFNLTATSGSGLPVTFTSSDPSIASISVNTVTIHKPGTITITATQAGNDIWEQGFFSQTQVINKYSQTITFDAIPDKTANDLSFQLSASSNSGLPITFTSSDPTIASISGSTVTVHNTGSVTITATQAGNDQWKSATTSRLMTINTKTSQTITFNALPAKKVGDAPFALTATASSNLPVTYTSSNSSVASISGNTVTVLMAGTITITATQAGNGSWNSATASQTLTITSVTGISEENEDKLSVYPNPTADILYFKGEGLENMNVSIFKLTGEKVWSGVVEKQSVNISAFSAGIYLLTIESEDIKDKVIRFVKQ